MRIGEMSSLSGVSIDTLRYYERIGLLNPERQDGRPFYGEPDRKLVLAIVKLKQMDFSLTDIKRILYFDGKIDEGLEKGELPGEVIREGLDMFKSKLRAIEKKEKELKEVKKLLRHIMEKIPQLDRMAEEDVRKGEER